MAASTPQAEGATLPWASSSRSTPPQSNPSRSAPSRLDSSQPTPSQPTSSSTSNPPLAYQRGYQDFYGRNFFVTPDVLIPRPESEQLIDLVLGLVGHASLPGVKPPAPLLPESLTIVDVGTGSGCLAITLKLELPGAEVYATDISEAALSVAQQNAKNLGAAPVTFIISHLLKNVKIQPPPSHDSSASKDSTIDVVVANLPYVDPAWPWLDRSALACEPTTALYAADRGLALIFELIRTASIRCIPYLVLEADPCQHAALTAYAARYRYSIAKITGYALLLRQTNKAKGPLVA